MLKVYIYIYIYIFFLIKNKPIKISAVYKNDLCVKLIDLVKGGVLLSSINEFDWK